MVTVIRYVHTATYVVTNNTQMLREKHVLQLANRFGIQQGNNTVLMHVQAYVHKQNNNDLN